MTLSCSVPFTAPVPPHNMDRYNLLLTVMNIANNIQDMPPSTIYRNLLNPSKAISFDVLSAQQTPKKTGYTFFGVYCLERTSTDLIFESGFTFINSGITYVAFDFVSVHLHVALLACTDAYCRVFSCALFSV